MSPAGRPPLPPEDRRTQKLPIRVSPREVKQVQENARKVGMGVSEWIKKRLGL